MIVNLQTSDTRDAMPEGCSNNTFSPAEEHPIPSSSPFLSHWHSFFFDLAAKQTIEAKELPTLLETSVSHFGESDQHTTTPAIARAQPKRQCTTGRAEQG